MGPLVNGNIDGVEIHKRDVFKDDRGQVMKFLQSSDEVFSQFGETYISKVNANVIKGWKLHKKVTQHFVIPHGKIKLVIFDGREDSSTKNNILEIETGEDQYGLIRIPPNVWYAFKGLEQSPSIIINTTTHPHDPEESLIKDLGDSSIPYQWD